MEKGFIYKIESPSGRIYIGKTINIKSRLSKYKSHSCKGQKRLHASLEKYGFDNHIFSVIESVDIEKLNERESFWQEEHSVLSDTGLNCKIQGFSGKSGNLSDETKIKISNSSKGKTYSEETRKKMSLAKLGKKLSESRKAKMRGRKLSPERVEQMRLMMIGNSLTKGIKPVNSRKVIDESTGTIYDSINDAALAINMSRSTLQSQLSGKRPNKTTLRIV